MPVSHVTEPLFISLYTPFPIEISHHVTCEIRIHFSQVEFSLQTESRETDDAPLRSVNANHIRTAAAAAPPPPPLFINLTRTISQSNEHKIALYFTASI